MTLEPDLPASERARRRRRDSVGPLGRWPSVSGFQKSFASWPEIFSEI